MRERGRMRGRGREEVRERGAIIKAESWRAFEERKTWASHHITSHRMTSHSVINTGIERA